MERTYRLGLSLNVAWVTRGNSSSFLSLSLLQRKESCLCPCVWPEGTDGCKTASIVSLTHCSFSVKMSKHTNEQMTRIKGFLQLYILSLTIVTVVSLGKENSKRYFAHGASCAMSLTEIAYSPLGLFSISGPFLYTFSSSCSIPFILMTKHPEAASPPAPLHRMWKRSTSTLCF